MPTEHFGEAHHTCGIPKPTTFVPCIARPKQTRSARRRSKGSPRSASALGTSIGVDRRISPNVSPPTNVRIIRAATLCHATAFGTNHKIAFASSHTATSSLTTAMSRLRLHTPLSSKSYRHPAKPEHPPDPQAHSQDRPSARRSSR
jgi:hypothetical protein